MTRTVVRGAAGAVAGARSRWREAEYGIVEDSASCAPAAAEQIFGYVGRGVGGLWGAGKGLLCGATLGIGKGVVAGVDKAYESAAPVVLSSRQQQKVNRRVESAAQACASEMAPLLGSLAAGFASGALEGCSMAERQLSRAYDVTMPEAAKRDIEQRLEKRFGAVMEHLVEPAVAEAVQSLYIGKIKPALTTDKRMPAWIRRILHDAADELWANVMVEVPHGLNKLVDKGAGGVGADGTEVVGGGPAPTPPPSPPDDDATRRRRRRRRRHRRRSRSRRRRRRRRRLHHRQSRSRRRSRRRRRRRRRSPPPRAAARARRSARCGAGSSTLTCRTIARSGAGCARRRRSR